ncbi:MAG: amino acid permease [Deltaproteobacteria bacterium]|nr:MAG: amino acid permease [Deltaproteobacteria bacterium]
MRPRADDQRGDRPAQGTLGTFSGVFTPSVLTILGIILFLRLGYVVGSAGLGRALLIIGLANAISVLTSISLSAIATNLKVKGGGDYYLISRTLGVEFGGAIGIVLFLAQSVSIAFYCIGFGEVLAGFFPRVTEFLPQIIAAFAVSFLFAFAWLGADWATRLQYVVMAVLTAALISFFVGGIAQWDHMMLSRNWASLSTGPGFWVLFAIFFPAVTGFTQGVSMSGDLKDPGKSLPLGTFAAVGVSILVYFGVALVFAAALPTEVLSGDYGAMRRVASYGFLIDAGVISATLSSAMASFLGAPRILQSVAKDRIFPFLLPFAHGVGPAENPRRGAVLSGAIAFGTIAMGELNIIAPLVSMFFLVSYGLLNYATYFEARASSPSFRPRFRWFDLRLSLLGGLACLGVMLAINPAAGVVAFAVLFAIYQYLKRTAGPARWADSRRSYHLQRVRENLLAAAQEPEHPRDWRPQLLAFSNDSHRRRELLRFASWLEGGSGLTTVVRIVEGEGVKILRLREEAEEELRADIAEYGLKAFPLAVAAPTLSLGVPTLLQSFGIGPLRVNTVLLNWFEQLPKGILGLGEFRYARNLRTAFRFGCNIVVLDAKEDEWTSLETLSPNERRIDVWWWGDATSRLMLLLAYLMTRSDEWSEARIRVLTPGREMDSEEGVESLRKRLEEVRIEAEPEVLENVSSATVAERSADAALVFLPFRLRRDQLLDPFGYPLEELLSGLPIVALVLAAEDIDLEAEPEEGKAGEIAVALDALADAEKKAREAEKDAAEAAEDSEKKLREIRVAAESGATQEELSEIEAAALEAKERANKAARRAAKAMAKLEDAGRTVEALGIKSPEMSEESEHS